MFFLMGQKYCNSQIDTSCGKMLAHSGTHRVLSLEAAESSKDLQAISFPIKTESDQFSYKI